MITGETFSRAERLLRIVVGDGMDVHGQFRRYQIDRQAYENFHQEMMSLFIKRCQDQGIQIPNKMIPVLNTLMAHHFLTGVVAAGLKEEEAVKIP